MKTLGVAREARNEVHVLRHELKAEAWLRIRKGTERLSRLEQELQEFLCRVERQPRPPWHWGRS